MGTHQRSILFPLGNQGYSSVAFGNLICARAVLLLAIALSRGLRILLEQPQGSRAALHPRLDWLLGAFQARSVLRKCACVCERFLRRCGASGSYTVSFLWTLRNRSGFIRTMKRFSLDCTLQLELCQPQSKHSSLWTSL